MITIELPFVPLSKSNNYRTGKGGRFYKTKACMDQEVLIIRATQSILPDNHILLSKPMKVTVSVFYTDRRRRDIDGHLKMLFDCMNGLVWVDDSLVYELVMKKTLGAATAATTITIEEIN